MGGTWRSCGPWRASGLIRRRDGSGSCGKFERARLDALRVLTAHLPEVGEQELVFRTRCAAGLLNWLALAPVGADLAAKPVADIERMLVPVVAGAFHGHMDTG